MKTLCIGLFWALATLALAQTAPSTEDTSMRIAAERTQWLAERHSIEQTYTARKQDCWQRFAVNACLSEVRRSRREALAPIRARELALNAEERAWRTRQRDERLRDKAVGGRP